MRLSILTAGIILIAISVGSIHFREVRRLFLTSWSGHRRPSLPAWHCRKREIKPI